MVESAKTRRRERKAKKSVRAFALYAFAPINIVNMNYALFKSIYLDGGQGKCG